MSTTAIDLMTILIPHHHHHGEVLLTLSFILRLIDTFKVLIMLQVSFDDKMIIALQWWWLCLIKKHLLSFVFFGVVGERMVHTYCGFVSAIGKVCDTASQTPKQEVYPRIS